MLDKIIFLIDKFNTKLGKAISWLMLLVVLFYSISTVLRYFFNIGATSLQESVMYIHTLIFLGASSWILIREEHVRVDIFYHKLSSKQKALVNLFGSLFFVIPFAIFVALISTNYILSSWSIREISSANDGLRFVYMQKSIIYIFAFCFVLQGLSMFLKSIKELGK